MDELRSLEMVWLGRPATKDYSYVGRQSFPNMRSAQNGFGDPEIVSAFPTKLWPALRNGDSLICAVPASRDFEVPIACGSFTGPV